MSNSIKDSKGEVRLCVEVCGTVPGQSYSNLHKFPVYSLSPDTCLGNPDSRAFVSSHIQLQKAKTFNLIYNNSLPFIRS